MFYKITQEPTALGVRLSLKNPDKTYYPKWHVKLQSDDMVAIKVDVPVGTIGLYLSDGEIEYAGASITAIPCVFLLINDQRLYVPKHCVRVVSQQEIEKELEGHEQQGFRQIDCD